MNMIEKRKQMRGQGGFTLIELLVVVAILGILAGVVVFAVGNLTDNATERACEIEDRTMRTAVEAARGSNAPVTDFLEASATPGVGDYFTATGTGAAATYTYTGGAAGPGADCEF